MASGWDHTNTPPTRLVFQGREREIYSVRGLVPGPSRQRKCLFAAQRAPVPFRGRRRRLLAMVLARAPVLAAVVRTVALLLAAAPGPPLATVEGVAPARSIAVARRGPNGLKVEK